MLRQSKSADAYAVLAFLTGGTTFGRLLDLDLDALLDAELLEELADPELELALDDLEVEPLLDELVRLPEADELLLQTEDFRMHALETIPALQNYHS